MSFVFFWQQTWATGNFRVLCQENLKLLKRISCDLRLNNNFLFSSQLSHSAFPAAFQLGFGPTRHFSGLRWQSISVNMLGQQSVRKQSSKPPSGYIGFLKALKKKAIAKVSYLDYISFYCKQDDSSLILARMSSSLQTSNTKQSNGDFESERGPIDLPLSS